MLALNLLEVAARVESHAASLLGSGVLEALDYACVNDFSYVGKSVSSEAAAGAVVALVGRNEGGKTLSRLDGWSPYWAAFAVVLPPDTLAGTRTGAVSRLMPTVVHRVAPPSPSPTPTRRSCSSTTSSSTHSSPGSCSTTTTRDEARTVPMRCRRCCAGVLHELALYGPGATGAARAHAHDGCAACAGGVRDEGVSRACGGCTVRARRGDAVCQGCKAPSDAEPGSSKPPPHIMVSYNWDHQHVILRVVAWLQAHGYLVWVDTEQMKGSTVDAMALAVEGSEVMLIGVSRRVQGVVELSYGGSVWSAEEEGDDPADDDRRGMRRTVGLGLLLGDVTVVRSVWRRRWRAESAFEGRMDRRCLGRLAVSRSRGRGGRVNRLTRLHAMTLHPSRTRSRAQSEDALRCAAGQSFRHHAGYGRLEKRAEHRRACSHGSPWKMQ